MSMFKSVQNLRNVVTLFHDAKIASSASLAKFINSTYTDKAKFKVDITEAQPTKDQLEVLEKLAPKFAEQFKKSGIVRPTLVDWFNGKIAVDDVSTAKEILAALANKKD